LAVRLAAGGPFRPCNALVQRSFGRGTSLKFPVFAEISVSVLRASGKEAVALENTI